MLTLRPRIDQDREQLLLASVSHGAEVTSVNYQALSLLYLTLHVTLAWNIAFVAFARWIIRTLGTLVTSMPLSDTAGSISTYVATNARQLRRYLLNPCHRHRSGRLVRMHSLRLHLRGANVTSFVRISELSDVHWGCSFFRGWVAVSMGD